jgi:hypothetical protein
MKILHLKLLRRMQVFQRFLKSTNNHPELVTFDFELKVLKLECILILVSHKDMV